MSYFRKVVDKRLGEILVERGVLPRVQLEEVLFFQKEKGVLFGEALVQMKIGTEVDVVQALTCQYGFPYLPLANYEIAPEVVAAVPRGVCHQYCLVPIDKIGRSLTLTMANPLNVQALEDVEKVTGCSVQAFISTAADINRAINRYYETRKSGDKIAF
jgi:type IV pilus assembly protein PilB